MQKDYFGSSSIMTYVKALGVIFLLIVAFALLLTLRGNKACSPCFKYFNYVDHTPEQLVLFNGNKEVTDIRPWEGVTSIPGAQPRDKFTVSGVGIDDGERVWIKYKINGEERMDSAVLYDIT